MTVDVCGRNEILRRVDFNDRRRVNPRFNCRYYVAARRDVPKAGAIEQPGSADNEIKRGHVQIRIAA